MPELFKDALSTNLYLQNNHCELATKWTALVKEVSLACRLVIPLLFLLIAPILLMPKKVGIPTKCSFLHILLKSKIRLGGLVRVRMLVDLAICV